MSPLTRSGTWRRRRLATARLYVCVGSQPGHHELPALLDAMLIGGVDMVQLRDKHADEAALRAAAKLFHEAAARHEALFIVNDDPALAAEVDADGVHVGQEDPAPQEARAVVGPERLVGRSTHSVEQVNRALEEDCDYFAVGPVHATPTKQGRPGIGLEPIRHAARVAEDRPWFVTGGMSPQTAPEVLAAGASRLVVVRAITEAEDPAAAAQAMVGLLR